MIESFRHKGLALLFEENDHRKVQAEHADRLRLILSTLHQAENIKDMDMPTFRLHELKGSLKGIWSVIVRANWRVTFHFINGNAYDVDLVDYH